MEREVSDLSMADCERCGTIVPVVADSVGPRCCGPCSARMAWKEARERCCALHDAYDPDIEERNEQARAVHGMESWPATTVGRLALLVVVFVAVLVGLALIYGGAS